MVVWTRISFVLYTAVVLTGPLYSKRLTFLESIKKLKISLLNFVETILVHRTTRFSGYMFPVAVFITPRKLYG